VGLPLPGPRPAPSPCVMTNSRPTGEILPAVRLKDCGRLAPPLG
jgi:hypothetical protein